MLPRMLPQPRAAAGSAWGLLSAAELEHGGAALGGIEGWGTKEEEVSRSEGWGCDLELRGPAAGGDLGDCRSSGCLEGAERVVDLASGLVVLEGVADLAAGQTGSSCTPGHGDLDVFAADQTAASPPYERLRTRALEVEIRGVRLLIAHPEDPATASAGSPPLALILKAPGQLTVFSPSRPASHPRVRGVAECLSGSEGSATVGRSLDKSRATIRMRGSCHNKLRRGQCESFRWVGDFGAPGGPV